MVDRPMMGPKPKLFKPLVARPIIIGPRFVKPMFAWPKIKSILILGQIHNDGPEDGRGDEAHEEEAR